MTRKTKTIIAIMMSLTLMIAMTACGSKDESAEEPASDSRTEEQTATDETADDYDIAANLKIMGDPKGVKIIDTDHFTLTLPLGGTWDYDYDSKTSITIYNIAGREADCGGKLMSLVLYDPTDQSYNDLPHACVAGETIDGIYVAEFPSDVQADIENEENMQQYQDVYLQAEKARGCEEK
jgi:predicted small lipoprotein YifL